MDVRQLQIATPGRYLSHHLGAGGPAARNRGHRQRLRLHAGSVCGEPAEDDGEGPAPLGTGLMARATSTASKNSSHRQCVILRLPWRG